MPGEHYRHIFLAGPTRTQRFTNPRQGGSTARIPQRDRAQHSNYLRQQLEAAWNDIEQRHAVAHVERHGAYIDFISEPGFELAVKRLESLGSGIRLLNVRKEMRDEVEQTMATVYVPHPRRSYFLKKVNAYAEEVNRRSGQPKNKDLIDSISDIRRSVLESFWRPDERSFIPVDEPSWVECWLNSDREEILVRFNALLDQLRLERAEGMLRFPERAVQVVLANRAQLESLIDISDDIAEFRLAKEVASFFIELENREQVERVREMLARTRIDLDGDVVVAILDSGVNNGHLLIQPALENRDLHTLNPAWGTDDDRGHGTLMAGTVLYGDLLDILSSRTPVFISHRLESVKMLPPPPDQNPKKLWGYFTSQAVSRTEIESPGRKRILCMGVTATDDRDRGRPSSWSGEVDRVTSGSEDEVRRLFIISAGNVEGSDEFRAYPQSNFTNEVHDPGQAWNALTVGAYTEKSRIADPTLRNYDPIAPPGGISPFSTTSSKWPARTWPIKPDVLFEGGNVARGPNDSIFDTDDLKLLSTYHDPQVAQFAPFEATSAAAAQAARMAARIQVLYQNAWPETIRGLMVHTAEWTDTMKTQFLPAQPGKGDYAKKLLRVCGYGVPNLERALYCAADSLTLISQAELQPYDQRDGRRVTRDMHLYNLPWPVDALRDLGGVGIEMRVTLSYFIEPGPGEIGWQDRYRYPSHALRFAVNGPGEAEREFISRVNKAARDDGEHHGTEGPGDRWLIGEARNVGSIHSDIWQGHSVDLADSNLIAVYPAVGWWRERYHLGRWNKHCRYSLIVSIKSPAVDIDIYTPVAIQVGIAVPVEVTIA